MRRAPDGPLRHRRLSRGYRRDSVPCVVRSKAPRRDRGRLALGHAPRPFHSGSYQRGLREEEDKAMRDLRTRGAIAVTWSAVLHDDTLVALGYSCLFAAVIAAMLAM